MTDKRDLLLDLIEQHPNASRDQLRKLYLAEVSKHPALVEEALRCAFAEDWAQARKTALQ